MKYMLLFASPTNNFLFIIFFLCAYNYVHRSTILNFKNTFIIEEGIVYDENTV